MLQRESDLFEDGGDSDGSRFEGGDVAKPIVHGVVALGVPPGSLRSSVHAAGFT